MKYEKLLMELCTATIYACEKYFMVFVMKDFSEILFRLEKKIERDQEGILENQNRMLARSSTIEEEIEREA